MKIALIRAVQNPCSMGKVDILTYVFFAKRDENGLNISNFQSNISSGMLQWRKTISFWNSYIFSISKQYLKHFLLVSGFHT